ncbi:ComEA family DNA-binding protein [Aeribacillus sp. FSL M8-0254]|uniref:ComEA family DNA-binding protein n=1 Tax=Aeribacillus sp. FSL M8-0254 TaxID=2954577 RepID=UPI0030FC3F37
MMRSITEKGIGWELRNSIWMLWVFFPFAFFNYISFFYAAFRVRQRKWFFAGLIYTLPFIIFLIAEEGHFLFDIAVALALISWVSSIFHVFRIRPEYLLRLESQQKVQEKNLKQLKEAIAKEHILESNDEQQVISPKEEFINPMQPSIENESVSKRIDVNHASADEIAKVPGVGLIFAKKILAERERVGFFQNFEHFIQVLGIKPHVAEKMRPYLQFNTDDNNQGNQKKKMERGRVVDF